MVGTVAWSMISDGREMGTLSTGQATDHGDEGVEMTLGMVSGGGLIEVHEPLLYGTIAARKEGGAVWLLKA